MRPERRYCAHVSLRRRGILLSRSFAARNVAESMMAGIPPSTRTSPQMYTPVYFWLRIIRVMASVRHGLPRIVR